ncbi:hypothetical protein ACQ86N_17680 [Puia sp. P3]|uniref:hypothetical protein n=1 Tax=Puia sp. P3 TaxID=3423952 RepID=UPI003D66A336
MPRKYYTEFGLNSYVTWGGLMRQGEFDYLSIPPDKFPQIYLIGKRPRISCDPNSLYLSKDGQVNGIAIVHKQDSIKHFPFSAPTLGHNPHLDVQTKYPNTDIFAIKKGSQTGKGISVATLLAFQADYQNEILDLEILYIGHSDTASPLYNIRNRIENHATLQKI